MNDQPDALLQAKRAALRLLRMRDYSRQEMAVRLRAKGFSESVVQRTLEWLVQERWLSDERVAQRLAERLEHEQPSGWRRIEQEFEQRGLSPPAMLESDEESRALKALQMRFGDAQPPTDERDIARWFRFLLNRGFEPEVARSALRRWNPFLSDARIEE
ncbi:Regulatory protein RecX [bacterium HR15]|nr:Regulatory protein RecX [bacterium HR15]